MSGVIVTGMDMPKYCGSCDMSGTGACRKWMCLTSLEIGKKRAEDCSLKSIDGLIEKIENIDRYATNNGHDIWLKTPEDIKKEVVKIIKEYCGVEE